LNPTVKCDAGVADEAARHDLDGIDVEEPAAADRLGQRHGPHEDVRDARAADHAVDIADGHGRSEGGRVTGAIIPPATAAGEA